MKKNLACSILLLGIFFLSFASASNNFAYNYLPKETGGNITYNQNITNNYYNATGNSTQFINSGSILTIKESWLETVFHSIFDPILTLFSQNVSSINNSLNSINTTANIQNLINGTGIYNQGNSSFNQSLTDSLYTNQTYVDSGDNPSQQTPVEKAMFSQGCNEMECWLSG